MQQEQTCPTRSGTGGGLPGDHGRTTAGSTVGQAPQQGGDAVRSRRGSEMGAGRAGDGRLDPPSVGG